MTKNFKKPQAFLHNLQWQIQQNGNNSTPKMYSPDGSSQFKKPFTPWLALHQDQQLVHDEHPSGGTTQFKTLATPFFDVPTKPLHRIQAPPFLDVSTTPLSLIPPAIVDPYKREHVERYAQWLFLNNKLPVSQQKQQAYQDAALETHKVGKREVRTFAPFQEQTSALHVLTSGQFTILAMLGVSWSSGLFFLHLTMLTITLGIVTLLYISGFITSSVLVTKSFSRSSGEKIDEEIIIALDQLGVEWPTYTILCPLFKEATIVSQFVEAMKTLHYPTEKLQVFFLTEEHDSETRAALYSMQLPSNFTTLTVPRGAPQTKPRACNFGLLQARGQFIVIFDAEDKPEPYQLKKAVLTFANHGPEVACVQAKLNYYNTEQNLLTRWFTAEYSTWFDILLPGLQDTGFSLPLGGTSNHFRAEALRALGGWDAFNVTEDCDLGLRISQYGLKTAVLDSTTYEEATSRIKSWLLQRSRWIKGYLQTYLVHMRHPVQTLLRGYTCKFFSLQLIVGAWTVVLFINPFMWALTIIYVLFHPVQLYGSLFPGPILYAGAFCLIFGNFFYVYIHLIGCLRRQEYALIKWVLLIPLYWVMMSISAYIAFYQLIVKPHHWEKTQHGTHLAPATRVQVHGFLPVLEPEGYAVAASMPTMRFYAVTVGRVFKRAASANTLETTTQRVTALRSALSTQLGQRKVPQQIHLPRIQDRWLIATTLIACMASTASTIYAFQNHLILIYDDAISHMLLGRIIFDNATPGLAQLGGVWLPLPHLLIALLAWNDYLWTTGLAGSIIGMIAYIGTAVYIFLTIRKLNRNSCSSFIGALVFVLNPNILYLQATPLTEPLCWVTFTASCYYLLAWTQEDKQRNLILAAVGTFLATLARYDGWSVFLVFLIAIPTIGILRRYSIKKIESTVVLYVVLGALGIALWLIWNQVIFGDFLYFQRGAYSSQQQTLSQGVVVLLRHHILNDVRYFSIDAVETLGTALAALTLLALIHFFLKRRKVVETLATLTFLVPFAFYVVALFLGQVNLFDNQATFYPSGLIPASESLHLFNSRFGSEIVAPAAIFIGVLVPTTSRWHTFFSQSSIWVMRSCLIILIVCQSIWILHGGVISVISDAYPPECSAAYPINVYLNQHYAGGKILQTNYPWHLSESESGIHFSNVIYEGNGDIWQQALHRPETTVTWIILQPGDIVATFLAHNDPAFGQQFTLVATGPYGLRLYHRNGLPSLPARPLSSYLLSEQQFCTLSNYQKR